MLTSLLVALIPFALSVGLAYVAISLGPTPRWALGAVLGALALGGGLWLVDLGRRRAEDGMAFDGVAEVALGVMAGIAGLVLMLAALIGRFTPLGRAPARNRFLAAFALVIVPVGAFVLALSGG